MRKCQEFATEKKEIVKLEEEIRALVYLLPGIEGTRYVHSFLKGFVERYNKAEYDYFLELQQGLCGCNVSNFISRRDKEREELKKSVLNEGKITIIK